MLDKVPNIDIPPVFLDPQTPIRETHKKRLENLVQTLERVLGRMENPVELSHRARTTGPKRVQQGPDDVARIVDDFRAAFNEARGIEVRQTRVWSNSPSDY